MLMWWLLILGEVDYECMLERSFIFFFWAGFRWVRKRKKRNGLRLSKGTR